MSGLSRLGGLGWGADAPMATPPPLPLPYGPDTNKGILHFVKTHQCVSVARLCEYLRPGKAE